MQQIWGTSGDPLILAPYGFLDYFCTKRYGTDFSGYESQEQTAKAPRTGSGLRWVANKLFGSGMQGMYM